MINIPSGDNSGGEQFFKNLAIESGRNISEIQAMFWQECKKQSFDRLMNPTKYSLTDDATQLYIDAGNELEKKLTSPELENTPDENDEYEDMMEPAIQSPDAELYSSNQISDLSEDDLNIINSIDTETSNDNDNDENTTESNISNENNTDEKETKQTPEDLANNVNSDIITSF